MSVSRVLHRCLLVCILLSALVGVPGARAAYYNGAFLGKMTGASGSSTFTLPAGASFPQVSFTDFIADADYPVHVFSGSTMDFTVSIGEFAESMIPGTMRYTFFQLEKPGDARFLLVGTYTLTMTKDSGSYALSGPVVGDGNGIYFAGKDNNNTPAVAADDSTLLIRARALTVSADPINPTYLGRAQAIVGTRLLGTIADAVNTTTTFAGVQANLATPLQSGSTFNQILPADGTGDVVLGGDTDAAFVSNITRSGTIGAGNPYSTVSCALRLMPAPSTWGTGFGLTRFSRVVGPGKTVEGYLVFDVAAPASGASAVEAYVFAFVQPRPAPALLFGTFTGAVTGTGATGTMTAELREVDSTPPDVLPNDTPALYTDRYSRVEAAVSDLNGWADLKEVQLLINNNRSANRILARYDRAANRLSLYNKATASWTASCTPGAAGFLATPWVSLSCKNTAVTRVGEILALSWSLKPTALSLGTWSAYVLATDLAGQTSGWRTLSEEKATVAAHP